MKEIRNKTTRPIRVPLPGGKSLHLGPKKTAQIADGATQHAGVERLVKEGTIEILGSGERTGAGGSASNVAEQTQSQAKALRRRQGER